jgi:hypothetical protein
MSPDRAQTFSIMSSDTVYKSHSYGAFEKLNGDNFPGWKTAMMFHLGAEQGNLLEVVTGEELSPEDDAPIALQQTYRQRQRQAASIIAGACAPTIKPVVGHPELYQDPARMWQILHSNYDFSQSASGRRQLRKAFDEAAPERGKPLGEFISRLETIQRQLSFSAQSIDDDTFIAHFLRKLPEEFGMEVKILQMMENPSRDHVLRAICQTEINQHLEASSSNTSSSTALYTTIPSSGPPAASTMPAPRPPPSSYRDGRGNTRGTSRNFQGPYRGGNQNRARPGRLSRPITNPLIRQAASALPLRCRNCSQPGHSASNCPGMQCWECGEAGHGRSTCPLNGMPGSAEQQRRGFEAFQRYQAEHPRTGQANLSQGNRRYSL